MVEGRRKAVDRLVTVLVTSAFGLALVPLVSILWTVVSKGAQVLGVEFFTFSMRNVVGEGGGIYHALIGTLLITGGGGGHLGADRPAHRDLPRRVRRGRPAGPLDHASSSTS